MTSDTTTTTPEPCVTETPAPVETTAPTPVETTAPTPVETTAPEPVETTAPEPVLTPAPLPTPVTPAPVYTPPAPPAPGCVLNNMAGYPGHEAWICPGDDKYGPQDETPAPTPTPTESAPAVAQSPAITPPPATEAVVSVDTAPPAPVLAETGSDALTASMFGVAAAAAVIVGLVLNRLDARRAARR